MPHSAIYKAVYIHIPKNAGTSIENWMNIDKKKFHKQVNGIEIDHMTAEQYRSQFGTICQSYYKFTIVRNPFDRMVSEFLYKKRYTDTRFIDATDMTFEEFIQTLKNKFSLISFKRHSEVSHFLPQYNYTHSRDGHQLVDYIGRFENLDDEIKKIGQQLGIKKPFLKTDQFSSDARLSCAKYYTQKSVEIVAKLYQKDFEMFGYSPTMKLEPIKMVHIINPYFSQSDLAGEKFAMKTMAYAKKSIHRDKVDLVACYLRSEYKQMKSLLTKEDLHTNSISSSGEVSRDIDGNSASTNIAPLSTLTLGTNEETQNDKASNSYISEFKKLFIDKTINDYVDLGLDRTRPLPLINDIFECLYNHTSKETDVVIYSNMDINVTKDFYNRIAHFLRSGVGHFCLNRSTVEVVDHPSLDPIRDSSSLKQLAIKGKSHPGYDCFVFYRSKTPALTSGRVMLGYTPIGEHLKNRLKLSHWSFKVYEKDNSTYHFGDDAPHYQKTITNLIYTMYNFQQSGLTAEFQEHCSRVFSLQMKPYNLEFVHHNVCKLNLTMVNMQNHQHCNGWNSIMNYVSSRMVQNDKGVYLIDFFDKDINKQEIVDVCYYQPWIGFFHTAPGESLPENSSTASNILRELASRDILDRISSNCKGLFVLTDYLKRYLKSVQAFRDVPIQVLCHPKEIQAEFNLADFIAKKKRKILHIGRYLRNIESFSKLKTPSIYQKHALNNSVNNQDYLNLLGSNIVFVDLHDASASNLVVECIVSNTPILINKIPPVVEYLGKDYPFYYSSLEEAAHKLVGDSYIMATHGYLKSLDKIKYSLKYFYRNFITSDIISHIRNEPFPVQNTRGILARPSQALLQVARTFHSMTGKVTNHIMRSLVPIINQKLIVGRSHRPPSIDLKIFMNPKNFVNQRPFMNQVFANSKMFATQIIQIKKTDKKSNNKITSNKRLLMNYTSIANANTNPNSNFNLTNTLGNLQSSYANPNIKTNSKIGVNVYSNLQSNLISTTPRVRSNRLGMTNRFQTRMSMPNGSGQTRDGSFATLDGFDGIHYPSLIPPKVLVKVHQLGVITPPLTT